MSSSDRRPYLTATALDQPFLNFCQDNLENRLEMVCDIQDPFFPGAFIRISDRNKYVGGTFYEALAVFPVINRTVGEWLAPEIQFSTLTIEVSNADGRFNKFLPSGNQFANWIGKTVEVKLGLRDVASTYTTIFRGRVTDIGGIKRSVKSFTLVARDDYERLSVNFPRTAFTQTTYPNIAEQNIGKILPVIYGDWTVNLDPFPALVPTFVTNGADANVIGGTRTNVQLRISENDLFSFDTANVWLRRGEEYMKVTTADVVNVGAGNKTFEIDQNTANLWVTNVTPAIAYLYEQADEFFVRVKGKNLGSYSDNIVEQARDIGLTFGGMVAGDFHANWLAYRDKAAPAQSSLVTIKSRVWENEPKPVIQYILSMLEQVRLEAFVDKDQKLNLNSLHFEDFTAQYAVAHTVRNWDVAKNSFSPQIDDKNNFNRAQAAFDFQPIVNENGRASAVYRNSTAITQVGREISKKISFPNLYIPTDVTNQLIEILRLASATLEIIDLNLTWRSMLQDIGKFINLNVQIGSAQFVDVPGMIRTIGYDPQGLKIPAQLWSFQMCPFPGYTPGYAGTVGGYSATIVAES